MRPSGCFCALAAIQLLQLSFAQVPAPNSGSVVPSPNAGVPAPSIAVPSPSGGVPSPSGGGVPAPGSSSTSTVAPPGPAPAPAYSYYNAEIGIGNEPAPLVAPAPSPAPEFSVPVIVTQPPSQTSEPIRTPQPAPAPTESPYFFCYSGLSCFDCDGVPLSANQQKFVSTKWNDTRCDDQSSTYNLNCARFNYDSGACLTTQTTTQRYTRPVYRDDNSNPNNVGGGETEQPQSDLSTPSMIAIIVCIAVAVVGGITVVVFFVIKKNKEREYAEFQA